MSNPFVDVSSEAVGGGGEPTVATMTASVRCPAESSTTYLIAVAVPVNVGSGSKVTVPLGLTS